LDSFHEEDYQPPLCSGLGQIKEIVFLNKDSCDKFLRPPSVTLPCCVIKGVVGKYLFYIEFPIEKTLEFKGSLNTPRKGLSSKPFNLRIFGHLLEISDYEDILDSHLSNLLSQFFEALTFHDTFLKWIEHFPQRMIPPTHLHELYFMVSDDMIHSLTHVIFVLNLSLFWFMINHRG
jgi:hypothetical protein